MSIYEAARRHDRREKRAEGLQQIAFGLIAGAFFFGLFLLGVVV